jgi:peptide/nickel transport system permease protein
LGICLLLLVVGFALGAQLLGRHDPVRQPYREQALTGPSLAHPLGIDAVGRDFATRLLYGARQTLKIAGGAMLLSVLLGGFLGACAGFLGGVLDRLISGATDFLIGFPPIILGLLIIAVIGPSTTGVAVAAVGPGRSADDDPPDAGGLFGAGGAGLCALGAFAGGVSMADRLVAYPAQLPGYPDYAWRSTAGAAILDAAGLSYLGLSASLINRSVGLMLKQEQVYLREYPLFSLAPGVAIALTVLASNLLADGVSKPAGD